MIGFAKMFFAALSLAAGSEEFDRTAAEGAARIVINQVKEDLQTKPFATDELKKFMLENSEKVSKRSEAEKLCREIYIKAARERLKKEAEIIFNRLSNGREVDKVFGEEFRKNSQTLNGVEEKRMTEGSFNKAFGEARKKACDEQAERLVLKIRPPMEEADKGNDAELRAFLTGRIAESQTKKVFEENIVYISQKIVTPIIENAKKEKRRQSEYVRRVRSDAMAPKTLSSDIAEKLVANVRERQLKEKNLAFGWDVFPSVTNVTLRNVVERRIEERLERSVLNVGFVVREEDVEKLILSEKDAHRKSSESRRKFESVMADKLFDIAVDDYITDAQVHEREGLQDYLKGKRNSKDIVKTVDGRIKDVASPVWQKVRKQMAEKEFEKTWPELADRTWFPNAALADEICSRADFSSVVKNWRTHPELSVIAKGKKVLEESDKKANDAMRDIFEVARTALVAQTKIVEDEMPGVLEKAIEKKESFWQRTPTLGDIVEMLTKETLSRWGDVREASLWKSKDDMPKNASEQHVELFPSVKRKIELVAKTVFEEMMKEKEERKDETEETPVEEEELCTISFEQRGSSITVKAEKGGKTIVERTAPLTAAGFEKAVKEVGEVVGRKVLRLK